MLLAMAGVPPEELSHRQARFLHARRPPGLRPLDVTWLHARPLGRCGGHFDEFRMQHSFSCSRDCQVPWSCHFITGIRHCLGCLLPSASQQSVRQSSDMAGMETKTTAKKRVVIVGGSIAGLSCAHALLQSGQWLEVVVFEKALSVTAAGAGLGLDTHACDALREWGLEDALQASSLPLTIEEIRAVKGSNHDVLVVNRDEGYHHRAAHWSDLHRVIHDALPSGVVRFGHEVLSFEEHADGESPVVRVRVAKEGDTVEEVDADFMVAADGSMSQTREKFVHNEKRRYSGYCAWRGVLQATDESAQQVTDATRKAYPDLGRCLYFDVAHHTHAVLYELLKGRLNWLWYINQPEPQLKGKSVTVKADEKAVKELHEQAEQTWPRELAKLMQTTAKPFINAIFDREPLTQFVWGRVALVGEAAHPTTPHGLRSTNMSIADASVLGEAVAKHGPGDVDAALDEFQRQRVPVTAREALFSRHLGQVKQGLGHWSSFDFLHAQQHHKDELLLQRNMHTFQISDRYAPQ